MSQASYASELVESFGRGWNRFWFTPGDPLPCCILRTAVGLLVIGHLLTLTAGLDRWYARDGILPPASVSALLTAETANADFHPSWFDYLGPAQTRIVHGLSLAVAAAFTAGLFTRVTGLATLAALLAYFHRLPILAGHVEPVLVFLVAYLTIGPSDARLSISRWLRSRTGNALVGDPQPSLWATLSLRLIQVHLAAFIAMMGLTKLNSNVWWDGEAIWTLLAQTHSRPVDLTWLRKYPLFVNFWTHAIVAYELAFPVLIWNRYFRPVLLLLGLLIWPSVIVATGLVLFALTMLAATLAYVPADYLGAAAKSAAPASAPPPAR